MTNSLGLRAKARQGNVRSTEVTDTVGGIVYTMKRTFDLLELEMGTLCHEIVE